LRGGERGVTLVELLMAVAILGIVSTALAGAFAVMARNGRGITERFSQSHDAQIASAYLASDVQSTAGLTSSACNPGSLTPVVNFQFADGRVSSYLYGALDGEQQLVRRLCNSGGTVVSQPTLVHNGGATPTAQCDGTTCDPEARPRPFKVKLTVPTRNESSGAVDFTFSLTGTRRAYVNGGAATPPAAGKFPALFAMGTSGRQLQVSGNGTLQVNGTAIVNSNATPAVQRSGNAVLGASAGIQVFAPGSCSGCSAGLATTRATRVPDPFAGLALPDEAGLPVYTDGKPSHGPGVYRNTALTFPNGPTTLAPGVYIVESGFNFAGQAAITGENVLLFNGCGLHAPGNCANTGTFNLAGQVSVSLTPRTSGDYAGLVIWQPVLNTRALTISGQGQAISISGVIYAPGASSVNLSSGNGGLTIGSVIGQNISVSGNGLVQVG
jgi:prepilin-type N-terminal cleavage/methylation domain-containing protein